jgi:hypothetical protein
MEENDKKESMSTQPEAGPVNMGGATITRMDPTAIWPETSRVPTDPSRAEVLKQIEVAHAKTSETFRPAMESAGAAGQEGE